MGEPIDLNYQFEPVDRASWEARVADELGGKTAERLTTRLLDGPTVAALYTEREAGGADAPTAHPGVPPFERGSAASREWAITDELAAGDVETLRERAARAVSGAAERLHLGPAACARIESPRALSRLVEGLGVPVGIEPGEPAVAWLGETLRRPESLELHLDPLGSLARTGELGTSVGRAFAQAREVVAAIGSAAPDQRPLFLDARVWHEGGASATDELGLALASGVEILRGVSEAGHPLADLPRRMRFAFALDADVFVGVAKLRAARLAWSKVLRTLGVDGPEQGMRIHAFGSRRCLSALDPHTNLLRSTAGAFAAVVGGAERITVAPFDARLGAPSPQAERLARNTQHLLRWESHLGHVLDPAAGSHYVAALTDQLARGAWAVLQEIEHLGGMSRAILDGSARARVIADADARREAVALRRRGLVGVNRYPSADDPPEPQSPEPRSPEPQSTEARASGPAEVRAHADASTLGALAVALKAAEGRTFAELHAAIVHGESPARAEAIEPFAEAAELEALRAASARLSEDARRARLVTLGDARALKARVDFTREILEVAGLRVEVLDPAADAAALKATLEALPSVAVTAIATTDDRVAEALGALAPDSSRLRVVAGRPGENEAGLRDAGADAFVYLGMNAPEVLGGIVAALGEEGRS